MSLRCINQQLLEQFRRVISSEIVNFLTRRNRDWSFSAARERQKARISTKFSQPSLSKFGVGGARFSSSCSYRQTRKVCGICSVSPAQDASSALLRNPSSSRLSVGRFGKLRTAQRLDSSPVVFTMGQKQMLEAKELKKGAPELKKGTTRWKEKQNFRNVSTAAEVCRVDAETTAKAGENDEGTNSPADPNGAPTTATYSTASAEKADEEVATEEIITKEVHVDAMLRRFLVGKGGSTKEKLEKDCKVKLKIPSTYEAKTSKSGCSITGTEAGIEAARKQMKAILDEAVQSKLQYTHFISLPLAIHPDLLEQVEKFQERILARNQPTIATCSSRGKSGASDEEKIVGGDEEKASVNGGKVKIHKAEIKDAETEDCLLEDEARSLKDEIPDAEKEKDVIMCGAESRKAEILDSKKRAFEEVKSPNAEILDKDKGVLEQESLSKAEVVDMEKGVVEVKVIPHESGIDKSIFVKPRTFHLTVLMLKLWNEERVQHAAEVLEKTQTVLHETLEGRHVVLDFKGVETMRGNPDKAHVLYARVEDSAGKTRLLQACQVLIDAYVESGLVMEKDIGQALKLHATLMNTTHRTVKKNNRFGKRIPFNAKEILEQYGEWKWGEFGIQEAHLSQRFVYGENGYYHCVRSIPFPGQSRPYSVQVASARDLRRFSPVNETNKLIGNLESVL